ncbi:MAG: hypothetical protein JWM80_3683 [Cyanobacteria bacterium RYN_339]|nr:hypothetical protein [Cyanobacteria bacterium RYN_339]
MIRRSWPLWVLVFATGCPDASTTTVSVVKKAKVVSPAATPSPGATAAIAASSAPALSAVASSPSPSPSPSPAASATPTPVVTAATPTPTPAASAAPAWSSVQTATGLTASASDKDDGLWAVSPGNHALQRYDAGGTLLGSYALPADAHLDNASLACDANGMAWLLLPADRAVVRCSAAGELLGPFLLPADGANVPFGPVVDAAGAVWVGSGAGTSNYFYQLLADGSLRATYDLGGPIDDLRPIGAGGLWVAGTAPRRYIRTDYDGQPVATYAASDEGKPVGTDAAGNLVVQAGAAPGLARIAPDATLVGRSDLPARDQVQLADGTLWVLADDRIAHLSSAMAVISTVPLGVAAVALGLDAAGEPWVALAAGGVGHLRLDGTVVATYPVGVGPRAISFSATGRVRVRSGDGTITFGTP